METDGKYETPFRVFDCYGFAWKSFSKWWIPLCLISGGIFIIDILPRLLTMGLSSRVTADLKHVVLARGDESLLFERLGGLAESVVLLGKSMLQHALFLLPVAMLLSTLLLLYATFAVHNMKTKQPVKMFVRVAIARLTMAIVKGGGFICFVVPGVYLYIKLFFVPLFMFEKQEGMWTAMKSSWTLTDGYFWEIMTLVVMNAIIQAGAGVTVIGVIPSFGFTNTVRAAAFRMILERAEGGV